MGAPLVVWGEDFDAFEQRGRLVLQQEEQLLDLPLPALIGRHQIVNAGTAVAAALRARARISDRSASAPSSAGSSRCAGRRACSGSTPARCRRCSKPGSELWLDGGHNPAAGRALAQTLADLEERAPKPLHLIVGMMGHKDAAGFLPPFRGLVRHVVTVPIPGAHEAPHPPEALAEAARARRPQGRERGRASKRR